MALHRRQIYQAMRVAARSAKLEVPVFYFRNLLRPLDHRKPPFHCDPRFLSIFPIAKFTLDARDPAHLQPRIFILRALFH
jgi:hypothetical protein